MTIQQNENSFYRSHSTNGQNDTCVLFICIRSKSTIWYVVRLGPLDVSAAFIESRPVFHFFFLLLFTFFSWIFYRNEKGSSILKLKWCRRVLCECVCGDCRPNLKILQWRWNYICRHIFIWDALLSSLNVHSRCCDAVVVAVIRLFVSVRLFALHSYSYPRKRGITIWEQDAFFLLFFTSKIK